MSQIFMQLLQLTVGVQNQSKPNVMLEGPFSLHYATLCKKQQHKRTEEMCLDRSTKSAGGKAN